jgi:hypothetical protein
MKVVPLYDPMKFQEKCVTVSVRNFVKQSVGAGRRFDENAEPLYAIFAYVAAS